MPIEVRPDDLESALRVGAGFELAGLDSRDTPGFSGDKDAAAAAMSAVEDEIADLQERLYANGRDGDGPAVLLVLQGMDTAGKGGIVRHVVGAVDPQGVQLTSFKAPTTEEKRHPFLWRIRRALPEPGFIGVFDRSHYEDVLIGRVRNLAPVSTLKGRYTQINTFERSLRRKDIHIIKVMLHVSPEEQKERLTERLDRPDKHWKFNPGDTDERQYWDAYQEAYQLVLEKTSTDETPWYVVPADRKWYARLAVQQLLLRTLRELDPQWPTATYDVESEKQRLAAT
nr:PPK2 family polyphosphate kinase [Demetria terragena]